MKKSIVLFLFFNAGLLFAQAPSIQWQKCLGGSQLDNAGNIEQTSDGGYILTGQSFSNDGNVSGDPGGWDAWVVKLDTSGNIQWQNPVGGTMTDYGGVVRQTNDGGYILGAATQSNDGNVSGNHGGWDSWVVKLDNSGNIQWQNTLGGTQDEFVSYLEQTTDGGYIVVGQTNSNDGDVSGNHGGNDYWVVKLDSSGNIQWQNAMGGTKDDLPTGIHQTVDSGYIVVGYTYSNDGDVSGNHDTSTTDAWVVKLNDTGAVQWQKCYGGTSLDNAHSIQQTSDGGYIIVGPSFSNNGDVSGDPGLWDAWVFKIDSTGTIKWQKVLGGSAKDFGFKIRQTADGGFIFSGFTFSNDGDVSGNHGSKDAWLVKLDATGNLEWQKAMGGTQDEQAIFVHQTNDGGYISISSTYSNDGDVSGHHSSPTSTDFWVVKLQSSVGIKDVNKYQTLTTYYNAQANEVVLLLGEMPKGEYRLSIINTLGKTVVSDNLYINTTSQKKTYNLQGVSNGVYYISVYDKSMHYGAKIVKF